MKIDTNTVNVLKNFSKINPSIVVQEGNVLKTISPTKTIMAKATVPTKFGKRFAIYNLDQFIALLSTFKDPELKFAEKSVAITEDNRKSHFTYADENTVTKAPEKEISLPSVDATFTLTNDHLVAVEKAAGILQVPEIAVVGDGKEVSLVATDSKNPTSNDWAIVIGKTDAVFKAIFKAENIKIIPGEYEVTISGRGISHFVGKDNEVEYFIAVESNSQF
jgi:hypothetical protein